MARMPEPILELKQWIEGLDLGKNVAMRSPSGDEEVPAPKQVKEKKRKDAPSSPVSKKKKPTKKSHKPKGVLAVQAQLELAEAQLRAAKENASVQIDKIKELQHRLDLATSDKASLADELEIARSEVAVARSEVAVARSEVVEANKIVDAKVAQFRIDVEVNQDKAKSMVKHAKWQARREALEGVSAQGFDVATEIENAKVEEARARRLAFPEDDSDSSSESEDGENPEDATSDEDQAT
ncbi:protein WEAK CHLOROPLAST MOVEMENT UNDER BLUE LIGHT 1-like [Nicotiana tomentosiformis]|uniref:protein WEAK CHLOROPLAST MOVEMENT UNDER BLUE LIGHT 1-like n=1 Tax=Nicotiana tomentosiformis TaxID=4098 RepID=UPI00388CDD35